MWFKVLLKTWGPSYLRLPPMLLSVIAFCVKSGSNKRCCPFGFHTQLNSGGKLSFVCHNWWTQQMFLTWRRMCDWFNSAPPVSVHWSVQMLAPMTGLSWPLPLQDGQSLLSGPPSFQWWTDPDESPGPALSANCPACAVTWRLGRGGNFWRKSVHECKQYMNTEHETWTRAAFFNTDWWSDSLASLGGWMPGGEDRMFVDSV